MQKDTYNSRPLTFGIWAMALLTIAFMVANVVVRPPLGWLRLMPGYCLAAFALLHSFTFLGIRRALWFAALGLILSFVAEYFGTNFGAVFGSHWFSRVRDLGFQMGVMLPGRVLLTSVLTWYGMLYVTFLTAVHLSRARPTDVSAFSATPLIAGFLMVVWQLTAGPVAVADGLVGFTSKGFYHSLPLSSFVGWYVTTVFILLFFQTVEPSAADASRFNDPDRRRAQLVFIIYGAQLLVGTLDCVRHGFVGAAWLGAVVFLLFLLVLAIRGRSDALRPASANSAA